MQSRSMQPSFKQMFLRSFHSLSVAKKKVERQHHENDILSTLDESACTLLRS